MKWAVGLLGCVLACTVGTELVRAAPASGTGVVVARAGGQASLSVTFVLKTKLISREAPNRLEFVTPWGKTQGVPSGSVHPAAEFKTYFGRVSPVLLRVPVPPGTSAGQYSARLQGDLYACDQRQKVCTQQKISVPVTLHVLAGGLEAARPSAVPVRLTDDLVSPPRKWLR